MFENMFYLKTECQYCHEKSKDPILNFIILNQERHVMSLQTFLKIGFLTVSQDVPKNQKALNQRKRRKGEKGFYK